MLKNGRYAALWEAELYEPDMKRFDQDLTCRSPISQLIIW